MRTISVRVTDLIKTVLPIGFAGENLHTRVNIDCKIVLDEYPTATVSMTVKPPKGDAYPAVVVRDGDIVTWDVSNSDLIYEGNGELQLAFVVDEVVAKSFIGKTRILRSIIPTGEIPDPIEDWITKADGILDSIPGQINSALEEAKESGEFDGEDGVSPEVSVEEITGGHQVSITDAEGTSTFDVMDGAPGTPGAPGAPGPGVSPGGTTGQVLKKKSNADYDTEWSEDSGGVQIDDTAGIGDTGVTWSANKSATELSKKYVKPSDGIPSSDMTSAVQTSLGKADTAYQKPSGGIPSTDMTSTVQTSLGKADSAYQKPSGGIPASDIANGVIPDVSGKADKVSNATSGDFAGLDSNGNLTDSGSKASDFISASLKGSNNGVAELDASGRVPSSQLPSYVDDVEEYSSLSAFPATGETGKIYIALDTNRTYRWSGSSYVAVSSDLALGETSSTAYRGDRGAAAYAASVTNVETTPTSGSSNLITSGAVYTGLESVDNQVIISDTQPTATSNKLWIDSDDTGTEVTVPTYAEMTTGLAGKVSDVQVNGTSVVTSGVANIPLADNSTFGVVKTHQSMGVKVESDGSLNIRPVSSSLIKGGTAQNYAVSPVIQHESAFYGLAKAAGADMASLSSVTLGQYPDAQKIAIQKMLGIYEPPYVLLNDITLQTESGFSFTTDSDGTPYNLRNVFIAVDYPADAQTVQSGYGRYRFSDINNTILNAETSRYQTQSQACYKNIFLNRVSNLSYITYTSRINTGAGNNLQVRWIGESNGVHGLAFDFGNVVKIELNSNDAEPAGTRIRIWGQWAY